MYSLSIHDFQKLIKLVNILKQRIEQLETKLTKLENYIDEQKLNDYKEDVISHV